MTPTNPLAQLHPLREPQLIGWWPPAPGWWLLLAITAGLLLVVLLLLWRSYRSNAYRRCGRAQLAGLYADYQRSGDAIAFAVATNALLKSVALKVFPRQQIAACSGPEWLALLNGSIPGGDCFPEDFTAAVYRGDAAAVDAAALNAAAARGIARHRVVA